MIGAWQLRQTYVCASSWSTGSGGRSRFDFIPSGSLDILTSRTASRFAADNSLSLMARFVWDNSPFLNLGIFSRFLRLDSNRHKKPLNGFLGTVIIST